SEIREYFKQLDPNPTEAGLHTTQLVADAAAESMASFVFRDYFLLLAKAAVQAAGTVIANFPVAIAGTETLDGIRQRFQSVTDNYTVGAGDTLDQVAHFYALSETELALLNPTLATTLSEATAGQVIPVQLGTTPQGIAAANPSWPLTVGLALDLGNITHPIGAGETLQSIAGKFGADLDGWLQTSALLDARLLLLPGATFPVPAARYANTGNLGLPVVAAFFFVRLKGAHNLQLTPASDGSGLVEWYAQAIADLNQATQQVLPAPAKIPSAYGSLKDPLPWTTQPGDTIWDVATLFALAQNPTANADFAAYLVSLTALNPGSGPFAQVALPAQSTLVIDNETLGAIATRLPLQLPDPAHPGQFLSVAASFGALVENAAILAPLTPVVVPDCHATTQAGQSLGSFAQLYDLSLEDLGGQLSGVTGLLAAWPPQDPTDPPHWLTVPHPWSASLSDVVTATICTQSANIAGQVSRFLLHGLRLPAPQLGRDNHYHATGPMTGLVDLVGQQLAGPAPNPNPPTGLTSSAIGASGFTVAWQAPVGDTVSAYLVSVNGASVGHTSNLSYVAGSLQPATPYLVTISARDPAGNTSVPSAPLVITTPGTAAPTGTGPNPPTTLVASAISTSGFTLSWTAPAGGVPATSYVVFANGANLGTTASTSLPVSSLQSATPYLMSVCARDADGNTSPPSAPLVVTTLVAPRLSLSVTIPATTPPTPPWIQLYDSASTHPQQLTVEALALNPELPLRTGARAVAALTDPVSQLDFTLSNDDLRANYPAGILNQVFLQGPAPAPQYRDVAVRHDLAQRILWQTTEVVPLPNPGHAPVPQTGMPGLWPFTGNLLAAALAHPTSDFALFRVDTQLGPRATPAPLARYAWATQVPITVRRIEGQPKTCELFGADTDGRQVLLDLWQYLTGTGSSDTAALHLLYQLPASSGLPNGLASTPPHQALTYIIKTNLSTETHSGAAAQARFALADTLPTSGEYYANLGDSARFLTLLWECSVIGGGGYWLEYTAQDDSPLPDSLFGPNGAGQLTLLVLLGSQIQSTTPARVLHPFNNCALVGDSIDASTNTLFAQVADQSETARQSTVAPGNVAFALQLTPPPVNPQPIDKQISARQLYSLLGYQLVGDTLFDGSNDGMPVGPQKAGGQPAWDVFQVVPISRYAQTHGLPNVTGLPAPQDDPYAGINAASSPGNFVMPTVSVALRFQDVFGNTSLSTGGPGTGGPNPVAILYGYTDPLVGLGAWPATTSCFHITAAAAGLTGAQLTVRVSLQASSHLPGPSQRGSAAIAAASDQLQSFARIYYQIMQSDVAVSLLTSLQQPTGGSPLTLQAPSLTFALQDFAAAACAWLKSVTQLTDAIATVSPTQPTTLAAISASCGVGFDQLALANSSVRLSRLFAPPSANPPAQSDFALPQYALFATGDTVATLCPAGSSSSALLADPENTGLPLRPGSELVIDPTTFTVPADPLPPQQPPTLAALAAQLGITVASLVRANSAPVALGTPGILRKDFVFTYNDVPIKVHEDHPDVSLDDIAATLTQEGIPCDAIAVAGANASLPGMFRAGAVLQVDRYLIQDGDTLAKNGSHNTLTQLAPLNTAAIDLFPAGAAFFIKRLSANAVFDEPLGRVASIYALSPAQLLRYNQDVALAPIPVPAPDSEYLVVPGQTNLSAAPAALRIPYRIPPHAKLAEIAALFLNADPAQATPAIALAIANGALPRVIAGNLTLTVDGRQGAPTPSRGASFATACALFTPPVAIEDLVNAIATQADCLAGGALLLCPPAQLPASAGSGTTGFTAPQVAQLYNLDELAALVGANRSLTGLVASGVPLSFTETKSDGTQQTYSITTGATDTLISLAWRFAQTGIALSTEQIVAANPQAQLFSPNARLLLAPPAAQLGHPIGDQPAGWQFPDTIFALHAWVQIARELSLVAEPFRGTAAAPGAAVLNQSSVPPIPRSPGTSTANPQQTLALQQFALDLQTAIPQLRVATGKVLSDEQTADPADLWAVAFGQNFIAKVNLTPGVTVPGPAPNQTREIPQFFALRPLQNSLVSRAGVPIQPLQSNGTLGTTEVTIDFQGIDLETWVRRLLSDIELFLSAAYVAPLYQTERRDQLDIVLCAKKTLAAAIATGLDYVYDLGQPDPARQDPSPADWASAVETLRQQLLGNLSQGYSTGVIVQYQAEVTSPWTTDTTRLSGPGQLPSPTGTEQRLATVGNAKISLATTPAGHPTFVNFPLTISEAGQRRSVRLDLTYPVNEIEFRVAPVVDGYDTSDWLRFVLPFTPPPVGVTFALGSLEAPLPLRAYPPLPALLGQSCQPTFPQTTAYSQAVLWNYMVTFQHQSMAVDQIKLQVEFNQAPRLSAAFSVTDDLFGHLAQYITVAPTLWSMLQALPASAGNPVSLTVTNAIATFATLVRNVANRWAAHWKPTANPLVNLQAATGPVPEIYKFTATLQTLGSTGQRYYQTLQLRRDHADGAVGWPSLEVFGPDGQPSDLGGGTVQPDGTNLYPFPSDLIPAFGLLKYQATFASLPIGSYQSADAQIQVVRNAQLVPGMPPTRAGFVYQTPVLSFADPLTPLLGSDTRFAIGPWTTDPATNPLAAVFSTIFNHDATHGNISCAILYGYELGGDATTPLVTYLPVKFRPRYPYDGANTVPQIIAAIGAWESANHPSATGGEWVFGLALYSSINGQLDSPILELRRLYSTSRR
ncbi:MAG TPA: fibronectin type III domain-containing protein, partial [Chthoniobacteraceae bacterium]|nr:fibronectin type III domain-containing protein [Chthoniobacteraceae bacterium]